MIIVAGLPDEPPIKRVICQLNDLGVEHTLLDQREFENTGLKLDVATLSGTLAVPDREVIALSDITAVYHRLHSAHSFADLSHLPANNPKILRFNALCQQFSAFADLSGARVINRTSGMTTNNSKPYQARIIVDCGLLTPETLITNSVGLATDFIHRHWNNGNEVIYKSASSVRSVVRTVSKGDLNNLSKLGVCPVQFQERIPGVDIRVHVVGQSVFASRIETESVDYRYSNQSNDRREIVATDLPPEIEKATILLAERLDLSLAGIDLRQTPDNRWYCFEVNPSPAYSFYESHTGQPIAFEIARFLLGNDSYIKDS